MRFPIHLMLHLRFCLLVGILVTPFGQQTLTQPDIYSPTPAQSRWASWQQHEKLRRESPHKALEWRAIGPRFQGGRIESIACPPGNTSIMYVGVGSGGLWKTLNNGITWKQVFEQQPTCAIGEERTGQRSLTACLWKRSMSSMKILMSKGCCISARIWESIQVLMRALLALIVQQPANGIRTGLTRAPS